MNINFIILFVIPSVILGITISYTVLVAFLQYRDEKRAREGDL